MITTRSQVLSVREVNENFPAWIREYVEPRFYHASIEFDKMKKHQANLKEGRGHPCPWANKLSEDAWVRRIRGQWRESTPETPEKKRGRPGWGFVVLLKIWIFAAFFRCEQNAEEIAATLKLNPKYARLCGLPRKPGHDEEYDTPSARTLRHFNQVMYTFGLWADIAWLLVLNNIEHQVFQWPDEVVIDPTHLDGFASVRKTCHDCVVCPKTERCSFKQVTCELTGIVSKSKNMKLPGVKLNLACLPDSEIVIAAIPCQGQRHDSKLFLPLLVKLAEDYPELRERVFRVLADAAHDDPDCRQATAQTLHAQLLTPINPRNRQPKVHPGRGIDYIDPYGVPICIAGHSMVMVGRDQYRQQYIWGCPVFHSQHGDSNLNCTHGCKQKCSPGSEHGRTLRVDRLDTPQINWDNPQHLASFVKAYNRRTTVERAISRCKRILKFERFFNRNRKSLQAHGDRYVIDIQLVAYVAHKLHRPEVSLCYRLTG